MNGPRSLTDQLKSLASLAHAVGLYDAAYYVQARVAEIMKAEARPTPEHAPCLDCDAYARLHQYGLTHCDCGADWSYSDNRCETVDSSN